MAWGKMLFPGYLEVMDEVVRCFLDKTEKERGMYLVLTEV